MDDFKPFVSLDTTQVMLVIDLGLVFCSGHGGVCSAVSNGVSNKEGPLFVTGSVLT